MRRGELAVALVGPKLAYLNSRSTLDAHRREPRRFGCVECCHFRDAAAGSGEDADGGYHRCRRIGSNGNLDAVKTGEQKSPKLTGEAIKLGHCVAWRVTGSASEERSTARLVARLSARRSRARWKRRSRRSAPRALSLELTALAGIAPNGKRVSY